MTASPEDLSRHLGREAGLDVPVHIASEEMDLSADLKRALSYARAGAKKKSSPANDLIRNFRPIIRDSRSSLFVPGVLYAIPRSYFLEASRSRVGTPNGDDPSRVHCIFIVARNGSPHCTGSGCDKERCGTDWTSAQTCSSAGPNSKSLIVASAIS